MSTNNKVFLKYQDFKFWSFIQNEAIMHSKLSTLEL